MKRVRAVLEDEDFQEYLKLTALQEREREFCRHDLQHAYDVARIFYILCLEKGRTSPVFQIGDVFSGQAQELLYATGLVHDIGRWRQYQDKSLDHALEGAALAGPILRRAGFSPAEISVAASAIREHRNPQAEGLGGFLYRADKISRRCRDCKVQNRCHKLQEMAAVADLIY